MSPKFHHVGVPSATQRPGETHLAAAKLYVTDPEASPYRIEWLRFEPGSPLPALLRSRPHVAFEVSDLRAAMKGKTVVMEPFAPMPGLEVGFILEDEALVELMERTK